MAAGSSRLSGLRQHRPDRTDRDPVPVAADGGGVALGRGPGQFGGGRAGYTVSPLPRSRQRPSAVCWVRRSSGMSGAVGRSDPPAESGQNWVRVRGLFGNCSLPEEYYCQLMSPCTRRQVDPDPVARLTPAWPAVPAGRCRRLLPSAAARQATGSRIDLWVRRRPGRESFAPVSPPGEGARIPGQDGNGYRATPEDL